MFNQLAEVFGKILLMISIGFGFAKTGILTKDMKKMLSTFLMKVILPFNILSSTSQIFQKENAVGMVLVLGVSCVYYLCAMIFFSLITRRMKDSQQRAVFICLVVFANVGFIGFPILGELYGDVGTLYTVAYNISYQLMFFTVGLSLLKGDKKIGLKSLLGNSIIYISLAATVLYFSPFRFPEFIQSTMLTVGNMMTPLSMIIIGCEVADMKLREIFTRKTSYLVSMSRLLIMPLIMALLLKVMGTDRMVATALVILTALPSGSLTVIAAQDNSVDTRFAANAVAQGTLLMIVTLPIIFMITGFLF